MIFDLNSLSDINYKIKKPFFCGENILFDLCTTLNYVLYFQSPSMIMPFMYNINNINFFTLTLCEYKTDKYTNLISDIIDKILNKVINKYPNLFENKSYINPLCIKPYYPKMFCFKNIQLNDIEIYNKFKEKISLDNICKNDMITCIFHIKQIWINKTSYGFNINLLQLRRDNNIKRGYIFTDDNQAINQSPTLSNIEFPYNKLSKKLTVPIRNIQPTFNLKELLEKRLSILGAEKT